MAEPCLPVLMYHGLHADAHARGFDPVYSVRPDDFARQLDWLCAHGYQTTCFDRLLAQDASTGDARSRASMHGLEPRESIVISFDDGDASNRSVALPMLAARKMVAEFCITSDFIGRRGMLSANDVRALARAGMGVQSHGRTHRLLEDLDEVALDSELALSKRRLEALCERPVCALALPGGRGGTRERDAAFRAGYQLVLTSVPGVNRGALARNCRERIAVTRDTTMADFAALVQWRGLRPRLARMRYGALGLPKRVLGNARYERVRAKLLGAGSRSPQR
ncbi:MAG TPA: polysaccharide deacetylase family protein [Rhodanobacteraceae bacterium]|nr:polysaccharide deacetylase family protein [Rhodanobacteraceae bacterium]